MNTESRTATASHTPGPWQVASDFIGPLHVRDAEGKDIAHVGHDGSFEICAANADLIAAAPDMLAALQTLIEGNPAATDQCMCLDCSKWKRAFAAIAKAMGGTVNHV